LQVREPDSLDAFTLRDVADADLAVFFEHQREPEGVTMAAFTAKDPSDRAAFEAHWSKIRADRCIVNKTIVTEGRVAGHIAVFGPPDEREVTYWLGREFWGRGLASKALAAFLQIVEERPLYARAAKDNLASLRVLEKCGFGLTGYDSGFANARGATIEEALLKLERP
jgi:RimJ/RimL family protein N-acetyltransferase